MTHIRKKLFSNNFLEVKFYLILLLPFALIAGPFLAELIIFLLFLLFFSNIIKNEYIKINKSILIYCTLFWFYLILNTIFNSISLDLSLKNSLFYFRFYLYSYLIFTLLNFDEDRFIKYLYFSFLFMFALFFLDYLFLIIREGFDSKDYAVIRFASFFGDEKVLGSFIIKTLPVFLILTFMYKKNFLLIISLTLLGGLFIIASAERTAFASYILFIVLLTFYKKFIKKGLLLITIFFGIFITTVFLNYAPSNRIIKATSLQMNEVYEDNFVVFSSTHHNMIVQSFEIYKKNIILGTGPKTYREACKNKEYTQAVINRINNFNNNVWKVESTKKYYWNFNNDNKQSNWHLRLRNTPHLYPRDDACETHPHNLLAQIISELGSIGLLFYILFYCYLFKEFLYVWCFKGDNDSYILPYYITIISLSINFLPIIPSGNFFNNWYSILLYYPFGFFIYFNHKLKR
tara:strand:+ start:164 stop:1543 length:1380 start_codon:yes stop_codon:yes gene_type:complete